MYSPRPTSRPLSYAPTPYNYHGSLSARINLDEEVKLAESAGERDLIDSLAEIYSIIRTLDGLEKAYIKDAVTEPEYTEICSKLLKQYKSILSDETVSREFQDLDTFSRKWNVCAPETACPAIADCPSDRVSTRYRKDTCGNPVDAGGTVAWTRNVHRRRSCRLNKLDRN